MIELTLQYQTPAAWTMAVLEDFDHFLLDHAAAEKKASGMALSMVAHYPNKRDIVSAMTDLAVEELMHFKQVMKLILARNITAGSDTKDRYIHALRGLFRQGTAYFLLDRLLIAGIIEARGYERFGLIAEALPLGEEKRFYQAITQSEGRHSQLFVALARNHFSAEEIKQRLASLLAQEAIICAELPLRATLH